MVGQSNKDAASCPDAVGMQFTEKSAGAEVGLEECAGRKGESTQGRQDPGARLGPGKVEEGINSKPGGAGRVRCCAQQERGFWKGSSRAECC